MIFSNDEHARAFVAAAEELGLRVPAYGEVRRRIGMGGDKLIPEAFGFEAESDAGKTLEKRKGKIFRERFASGIRPTPGGRELVERLRREGMRLVVVTSANEEDLKLLLEKSGVTGLVDACTSSDDVDESKPHPDLVIAGLELAGVEAAEAVMLGDTPYDVEAATRAGVGIVGVETGGWKKPELVGALRVYETPAAIVSGYSASPFA